MSTTSGKQLQMDQVSIVEKFSMIQPDQFGQELEKVWRTLDEQRQSLIASVENKHLSPQDARRAFAAVVASLTGYDQDRSGESGQYVPIVGSYSQTS